MIDNVKVLKSSDKKANYVQRLKDDITETTAGENTVSGINFTAKQGEITALVGHFRVREVYDCTLSGARVINGRHK